MFTALARMEKRAHLIALIGVDGAGKTTQSRELVAWLAELGHEAIVHPNESLQPLKATLALLAAERGYASAVEMVGPDTHQLLLATIKWNTMFKVHEHLAMPERFVVMDRYSYCQVAAARCLGVGNRSLVEGLFAPFPTPDLTLFLDISPEEAQGRMEQRGGDAERLSLDFLRAHAAAYRELPEADRFVRINAERPRTKVVAEIRLVVQQRFPFLQAASALGGAR